MSLSINEFTQSSILENAWFVIAVDEIIGEKTQFYVLSQARVNGPYFTHFTLPKCFFYQ